jgi:hypothetical protein
MYAALRDAGITVYLPGQHDGPCKTPYVVVSDGGTMPTGKTTGIKRFLVTGYVPLGRLTDLRAVLAEAQAALRAVPAVRTTGEISHEEIDDERAAHFASIEYAALCSLI